MLSERGILMPLDHSASQPPRDSEAEMPTSIAAFPVLLALQYVRGQTHGWLSRGVTPGQGVHELPDVLASLQRLAVAGQAAGFSGFARMCLRVTEQLERLCPESRVSNAAAQLLIGWIHHADRYLRKPSSRTLIATLVSQMGSPQWPAPLPAREQDRFIHEMLAPFA
jgi:hypothetical protein